jgi:hypothetical protein
MAPAAAQAQAMAGPPVIGVPCSTSALVTAINAANGFPSATVRLHTRCTYFISTPVTAADGLPAITGHVTLAGGYGTQIKRISSAPSFRILEVAAAGSLRLTGVTVLGASTAGLGGGVLNAGTATLIGDTFSGNTAGNGGGLSNAAGATALITGSHFAANATTGVGGGAIINSGTLTVIRSTFNGNTAPINGGALNVQSSGVSRIFQSTFTGNVSGSLGGAISNLGTITLFGSAIRHNKGSSGGGIATGNTHVHLFQGTVVQANVPTNCNPINTIPGCRN